MSYIIFYRYDIITNDIDEVLILLYFYLCNPNINYYF